MIRDAAAWLSAAHLFEIARRLAMPQARVKHSAPALRSLAEESANKCQEALRSKAGEGTAYVLCEYAVFYQISVQCIVRFKMLLQVHRGPGRRWNS